MASLDLTDILTKPEPTPPWLIEDFLCEGTIVILAGEPGVGKSVLSYTLSIAVASGNGQTHFLGRPAKPGKVLYFDEENSLPDARQYLRWAWRGLGKPLIPPLAANFKVEHFSLVSQGISRYDYMVSKAMEFKPSLIVLDTATPVCHIQDENDNGEASLALRSLRRVRSMAGPQCTILVLKHAKLLNDASERRTIRGAKAWLGEADAVLYHVATPGRPRKDGLRTSRIEPDKVRAFGLRDVIDIHPEWTGELGERGLKLNVPSYTPSKVI